MCGLDVEALRRRCSTSTSASAPTFDEDEVQRFDADTVIFATGQFADVARPRRGAHAARRRHRRRRVRCATSVPRVYAAGDVVTGPSRVIDAIAAGHRVGDVHRARPDQRCAAAGRARRGEPSRSGEVPQSMKSKLETRKRVQMEKLEFYEAVETFDEIEAGYTEYEAAREAQRCLGCTTGARLTREKCASCLTCMRVCPHNAPGVKVGGFLYFDAETCHACGACVSQCPAQAISLEGHSDEEMIAASRARALRARPRHDAGVRVRLHAQPARDSRRRRPPAHGHVPAARRRAHRAQGAAVRAPRASPSSGCVEANCRYPHARESGRPARPRRSRDTLHQLGMDDALRSSRASHAEEEDVHLR